MDERTGGHLGLFLGIAFLLPLIAGGLRVSVGNSAMQLILYGIEAAAPSAAAVIAAAGERDLGPWIRRNWKRERIRSALFLSVGMAMGTMLLAKVISCFWLGTPLELHGLSRFRIITVSWSLIAEEAGWRGWLQPALYKRIRHPSAVPFLTGTIWCAWHYHIFLFDGIQVPLIWFFLGCIAESYIYAFLMERSEQNLLSAMEYHFAWNLFLHLFALNPADNGGSSVPYAVLTILEGCVGMVCLRKQRLTAGLTCQKEACPPAACPASKRRRSSGCGGRRDSFPE